MKRSLFILCILVIGMPLLAQNKKSNTPKTDVIITVQSEKIDAIITEVSDETISYKKASNPNGPTFILSTEKISTILYANGEIQVIKHKVTTSSSSNKQEEPAAVAVTPTRSTTPYSQKVHYSSPSSTVRDASLVENKHEVKPAEKFEETIQDNTPDFSICGHLKGFVNGFGSGSVAGGFGLDLEMGFVTGRDINFLGAGIGFDINFATYGKTLNVASDLPIYACDRLYLSSSSFAPYLDLALGGFINTTEGSAGTGGLYFHPGLGLAIPVSDGTYVHLNVGYELRYSKVQGYDSFGHAIYFRIGFGGR